MAEDNTESIVRELNQPNVDLVKRDGLQMHEALHLGLDMLKDCDKIFITDADEFILRKDQEKMVEGFTRDVAMCPIIDYASFDSILPMRTHTPIVMAKPTARFIDYRNSTCDKNHFNDIYVHHLGYMLEENNMKWKKKWEDIDEPNMFDSMVCRTHIPASLPDEIRSLING